MHYNRHRPIDPGAHPYHLQQPKFAAAVPASAPAQPDTATAGRQSEAASQRTEAPLVEAADRSPGAAASVQAPYHPCPQQQLRPSSAPRAAAGCGTTTGTGGRAPGTPPPRPTAACGAPPPACGLGPVNSGQPGRHQRPAAGQSHRGQFPAADRSHRVQFPAAARSHRGRQHPPRDFSQTAQPPLGQPWPRGEGYA
nr:circumsporozoite protein-like [Aegilops tauschii subsp. strangulata]